MFKNKVLMITGGTGSFGNTVLNRFLSTDVREIRIFSRDEKKQEEVTKLRTSAWSMLQAKLAKVNNS